MCSPAWVSDSDGPRLGWAVPGRVLLWHPGSLLRWIDDALAEYGRWRGESYFVGHYRDGLSWALYFGFEGRLGSRGGGHRRSFS